MKHSNSARSILALSPAIVLLAVYLAGALLAHDFYKVPFSVPFTISAIYSVLILTKRPLSDRIEVFSRGASNANILYMLWIFILAGIFASSARMMGAVDGTVNLTLRYIPEQFLPFGIFLMSCFVSLSIGTSVGTIVALMPIVSGISSSIDCNPAWLAAIVVGGAFFGDNLSFISDTTIASTQSQGCSMRDKFRTNFLLVLPAAIISMGIYLFAFSTHSSVAIPESVDFMSTFPYLAVILMALLGLNVLVVLVVGIILADGIGSINGTMGIVECFQSAGEGISSMSELIVVTMLAGGIMNVIREKGGMDYLIDLCTRNIRSRRAAEAAISLLTALVNVCTANNTIAIITTGPIAREVSQKFGIPAKRSASLMDTSSCCVQGLIPYGIQVMMAAGLISVSPIAILPYLYYPMLLGGMVLLSILLGKRGK